MERHPVVLKTIRVNGTEHTVPVTLCPPGEAKAPPTHTLGRISNKGRGAPTTSTSADSRVAAQTARSDTRDTRELEARVYDGQR